MAMAMLIWFATIMILVSIGFHLPSKKLANGNSTTRHLGKDGVIIQVLMSSGPI